MHKHRLYIRLFVFDFFTSTFLFQVLNAQNSVGIGTTSPNAKAVLHLEANGAQGLLVPVLGTSARTGMGAPLLNTGYLLLEVDHNHY